MDNSQPHHVFFQDSPWLGLRCVLPTPPGPDDVGPEAVPLYQLCAFPGPGQLASLVYTQPLATAAVDTGPIICACLSGSIMFAVHEKNRRRVFMYDVQQVKRREEGEGEEETPVPPPGGLPTHCGMVELTDHPSGVKALYNTDHGLLVVTNVELLLFSPVEEFFGNPHTPPVYRKTLEDGDDILRWAISSNYFAYVTRLRSRHVNIISLAQIGFVHTFETEHKKEIASLAVDNLRVATVSTGGTMVYVWNVRDGVKAASLRISNTWVEVFDGSLALSGSGTTTIDVALLALTKPILGTPSPFVTVFRCENDAEPVSKTITVKCSAVEPTGVSVQYGCKGWGNVLHVVLSGSGTVLSYGSQELNLLGEAKL